MAAHDAHDDSETTLRRPQSRSVGTMRWLTILAKRLGLWGACPGTIYDPYNAVTTRQ